MRNASEHPGVDHSPNENERSHGPVSRLHQTSHIKPKIAVADILFVGSVLD